LIVQLAASGLPHAGPFKSRHSSHAGQKGDISERQLMAHFSDLSGRAANVRSPGVASRNCCWRHETGQRIDRRHQLARARWRNADTVVPGIGRTRLGQATGEVIAGALGNPLVPDGGRRPIWAQIRKVKASRGRGADPGGWQPGLSKLEWKDGPMAIPSNPSPTIVEAINGGYNSSIAHASNFAIELLKNVGRSTKFQRPKMCWFARAHSFSINMPPHRAPLTTAA